jgi:chromosome partitioning protein
MLMNAKGGCGKTTLATNIATWYADDGAKVALADFDPQRSSLDWLEARQDYDGIPKIEAIDATQGPVSPARGTDYLIMDAPAAMHGKVINSMLRRVQSLIIPVLPSPIDMRACGRFLDELLASGRVSNKQTKIAIVANRVRENTIVYRQLEEYLDGLKIPLLTHLRESQNYIRAAERGLGLFELAPSMVWADLEQWDPILSWLDSARSQPKK